MKRAIGAILASAIVSATVLVASPSTARVGDAVCTSPGSGGGTWGSVLVLCIDQDTDEIYVAKADGGTFTSSGTMRLRRDGGMVRSETVSVGDPTVSMGPSSHGCFQATFDSNAPGTATTGRLCITPTGIDRD